MRGVWVWIILATFNMAVHAEPMLRIRSHLVVNPGSNVKLYDLVDGQELSAELKNKLSLISLTVAPAFGEREELPSSNLMSILRPLIIEERARTRKPLHLVVPSVVTLDTTKHELDETLLETEMLQAWQPLCADCKLEIEGLVLPKIADIRDWTLRLKAELPRGSFSVPVDLVRANGATTSAWISGRILIKKKVPLATRAIAQGERIAPKDFTWEYRDTSYSIDGIPSPDELVGRRIKQGLRVSDILWKGMLERERAIHAGETIQIRAAEGTFEISLSVVAQQDGFIGDIINVKNTKTNGVLMGLVTGQGEVELR